MKTAEQMRARTLESQKAINEAREKAERRAREAFQREVDEGIFRAESSIESSANFGNFSAKVFEVGSYSGYYKAITEGDVFHEEHLRGVHLEVYKALKRAAYLLQWTQVKRYDHEKDRMVYYFQINANWS